MSDTGGAGWSQPVNKTITALAGTPMLLVLAVLNVMMFGMVTYLIIKSAEYRFKERADLIELFANCMKQQRSGSNGARSGEVVIDKLRQTADVCRYGLAVDIIENQCKF